MTCLAADQPPPLYGLVVFDGPGHAVQTIVVVFENPHAADAHARRVGLGDYVVAPLSFCLDRAAPTFTADHGGPS